jgi:signal transduction histidine kinase/DNA-binding response OmpR family regulator
MNLEQQVAELTRELAEVREQQVATNEVLQVIGRFTFDLQPVFNTVVEHAIRLCRADSGMIYILDGEVYRLTVAYGGPREYRALLARNPIPPGRGTLVGKVALESRTIQIPDVLADPDYQWQEAQKLGSTRTLLGVPMLKDGMPVGVIVLIRTHVHPFTDRQIELVTTFAAQGVIAIENVRLFQELQSRTRELARSVEELQALGEISQAVNSSLDLQEVLTTIVIHAVQLSGADVGSIYQFDHARQEFKLRAAHGLSEELMLSIRQTRLSLSETVMGRAALQHEPIQVPDLLNGLTDPLCEIMARAGFRALLAVPLLRQDRIIGVLVVRRKAPGLFPTETVQLLQTFASESVLAIENARLFQEVEEKNRQLEVASQHKSEFLASMSHELRTPLNAIIGFSEVLLEQMFGDLNAKQVEYLQDILSSGRLLLDLINDILDLSKVEAGRMELELGRFFLPEALASGLTMVQERASRHGIALGLDMDPEIGIVEADERKIKQVLFNLLSNAVKFTPDGGRVDVMARLVDGEVHLAVKDTGIGIAPEDQVQIFESFQRAKHTPVHKQEGTGLGLALSKKFVEMHGGRIWLESQVGAGSTFTFTLPIQRTSALAEVTAPEASAAAPAHLEGSSPTVLLVEDDPSSVELLTLYLNGAGFTVAVAHDGEEGLALAHRLRPSAIILDILLPGLDGWEFLHRAKADPLITDIPVIIVSMLDEPGKGFAMGAAGYLVKPVSRDELLTVLRRCIHATAVPTGSAKVLAIDDDPMAIELIEAVLKPEGHTVLKATGGEEGVTLARQALPAVVILDLLMPEVDGFTVVERLRADPATAAIPIVILTSKSMTREEKERLKGQISYLAQKAEFNRAAFVELVRGFCQTTAP